MKAINVNVCPIDVERKPGEVLHFVQDDGILFWMKRALGPQLISRKQVQEKEILLWNTISCVRIAGRKSRWCWICPLADRPTLKIAKFAASQSKSALKSKTARYRDFRRERWNRNAPAGCRRYNIKARAPIGRLALSENSRLKTPLKRRRLHTLHFFGHNIRWTICAAQHCAGLFVADHFFLYRVELQRAS